MKRAYERHDAERLLPLLRSIATEIEERSLAIRLLERALRSARRQNASDSEIANIVAPLASHKFELRRAQDELRSLGVVTEPGRPRSFLVPGPDGKLESGFELALDDPMAEALAEPASTS